VGQESNLQPAVVETQSGVLGGVAICRSARLSLSSDVADCRRVSPVTGADDGAADAVAWHEQQAIEEISRPYTCAHFRGAGQSGPGPKITTYARTINPFTGR
jgi:hypothetical protein